MQPIKILLNSMKYRTKANRGRVLYKCMCCLVKKWEDTFSLRCMESSELSSWFSVWIDFDNSVAYTDENEQKEMILKDGKFKKNVL